MSIQSEIDRINNAKNEIAEAIEEKGVNVPNGTSIDDMSALVRSIPQEGGSGGGGTVLRVTGELNAETMQAENISHFAVDVVNAFNSGEAVQFIGLLTVGFITQRIVFCLRSVVEIQGTYMALFDAMVLMESNLYYISIQLTSDNSGAYTESSTTFKVIPTM